MEMPKHFSAGIRLLNEAHEDKNILDGLREEIRKDLTTISTCRIYSSVRGHYHFTATDESITAVMIGEFTQKAAVMAIKNNSKINNPELHKHYEITTCSYGPAVVLELEAFDGNIFKWLNVTRPKARRSTRHLINNWGAK
jgi:ribosomal protein RSM22 (predicted rRNA methylase)